MSRQEEGGKGINGGFRVGDGGKEYNQNTLYTLNPNNYKMGEG